MAVELSKSINLSNCAICLEDIQKKSKDVLVTTCAHLFHETCLVPWLRQQSSCPTCKTNQEPNPYLQANRLNENNPDRVRIQALVDWALASHSVAQDIFRFARFAAEAEREQLNPPPQILIRPQRGDLILQHSLNAAAQQMRNALHPAPAISAPQALENQNERPRVILDDGIILENYSVALEQIRRDHIALQEMRRAPQPAPAVRAPQALENQNENPIRNFGAIDEDDQEQYR